GAHRIHPPMARARRDRDVVGGRFRGLYDDGAARDRGRRSGSYLLRRRLGRRRRPYGHRGYFRAPQGHRTAEGGGLFRRGYRENVEREHPARSRGARGLTKAGSGGAHFVYFRARISLMVLPVHRLTARLRLALSLKPTFQATSSTLIRVVSRYSIASLRRTSSTISP